MFCCLRLDPDAHLTAMLLLLRSVLTVGILFFLGLALYVLFFQEQLQSLARDYISTKIEPGATQSVLIAEELLQSPQARTFLSEAQITAFQLEIAHYRDDPAVYIRMLTDDDISGGKHFATDAAVSNPLVRALLVKMTGWKEAVERHFHRVFQEIISDLLIFACTNLIACAIALWLSKKSEMLGCISYKIASIILTASIVFGCFTYLGQDWFFTILLNSYFGTGYPILIITTTGYVLYRYREMISSPR